VALVLRAGHRNDRDADAALSVLCERYWYPLYAYVRRHVADAHEAQDLTQEFFARLLEKQYLAVADPQRGKFRCFLLASLKHFLANEWDRAHAQKRGGGVRHLSLDLEYGESRLRLEPSHDLTPERLFERLPYAALAAELGMSEEAARQAANRLRKRYRELLRAEVAQTLAEPAEVDDEIRNLFEVLGG